MDQSVEILRELFARRGLRATPQREVIFRALRGTTQHPTAEELHESVRTELGGVSLATVYNTLEALASNGLCRKLTTSCPSGGSVCRYDAETSDHVHVVSADGRVRDLRGDLGDSVLSQIRAELSRVERETGVRIGSVNVELVEEPDPSN